MFIGIGLRVGMLGSVSFNPAQLFNSNEQGAWYDPSDRSTLFQDSNGITPVTATGDLNGLTLDKRLGLARGPELVTNGTFDTDSDWTKGTGWTITGGQASSDGTQTDFSNLRQDFTLVVGQTNILEFDLTISAGSLRRILVGSTSSTFAVASDYTTSGNGQKFYVNVKDTGTGVIFQASSDFVGSVGNVSVRSLAGNHARQETTAARLTYFIADNGDFVLQNDEIDDALVVNFPNMGSSCTVAFVTQGSIYLEEDITLNGAYTLPQRDLLGYVAIDRALTVVEKIQLIRYLASKAQGVNYGADLGAIALAAINAVDVFVYDTTKDSDGGAWINGTIAQGTSWYTETLNTSTRGATQAFPALALVVAEAGKVTIYDATDPDLPMWRVFNRDTSTPNTTLAWWRDASTIVASSVTAKNAILSIGLNGAVSSNCSLLIASFLADDLIRYSDATNNSNRGSPISSSNNNPILPINLGVKIVSREVNDVAMTILSDAPTDAATGLKVPTIAVATDGGVSVITDSGDVFDSSSTIAYTKVYLTPDEIFAVENEGAEALEVFLHPTSDGFTSLRLYRNNKVPNILDGEISGVVSSESNVYCSTPVGFNIIKEDKTNDLNSMVASLTSTSNSGWMHGDNKGAFLSSTDATDLVGTELVTNGDGNNATGWSAARGNSTISSNGGRIRSTANLTGTKGVLQSISGLTVGASYYVRISGFNGPNGNVTSLLRWSDDSQLDSASPTNLDSFTGNNATGSFSGSLLATATTMYIGSIITGAVATEYAEIDDISVRIIDEPDRSVNDNGLAVFGTITKTAVATGAELIGYSGFSADDYLEQPYNSDLNFGTGDFSIGFWYKNEGTGSTSNIIDRRGTGGSGVDFVIFRNTLSSSMVLKFKILGTVLETTEPAVVDVWEQWWAIRVNGIMYWYRNGELEGATPVANTDSIGSDQPLKVGEQGSIGSLALLRIGATAPSAAQILKIYNDEKYLFVDNAACTLNGASDAVTALAYDEDTDLLHAGTSAGRSVFRGLQRINNTTTSVSTAISASGGFIAEK
jgi:hypothetical protein